MNILIVEDDRGLNRGIKLSLDGFSCLQAYSVGEAEKMLENKCSLVILDINLPDGSGLDLCRRIKKKYGVPVIFLTANDMEYDIVTGLESGADDYITKPFSLAVLRARVNAVLRRNFTGEKVFSEGGFMFDFERMEFYVRGQAVELSKTEQRLLRLFVNNRGITLSRDMLIDRIWSEGAEFVEENALSVAVSRLRAKLGAAPIKTVYGIGYVWEK